MALQYWLAAVARHKGIFGLVLADSAGLLVASSLRGQEAEELAALAPLLAGDQVSTDGAFAATQMPLLVHRTMVDRCVLYLCAVGDQGRVEDGVRMAEGGIKRILTTH